MSTFCKNIFFLCRIFRHNLIQHKVRRQQPLPTRNSRGERQSIAKVVQVKRASAGRAFLTSSFFGGKGDHRLKWRLANDSPTLRGLRDPNPLEAGLHLMALQSVNWCTTFSLSPFTFAHLRPLFSSFRGGKKIY